MKSSVTKPATAVEQCQVKSRKKTFRNQLTFTQDQLNINMQSNFSNKVPMRKNQMVLDKN